MLSLLRYIIFVIFFSIAFSGIPFSALALEVSSTQTIHAGPKAIVGGTASDPMGGFSLPNLQGASSLVTVTHRFSTENENQKPGDLISFSYSADAPITSFTNGQIFNGNWCQSLTEQCVSFAPTSVYNYCTPQSPAIAGGGGQCYTVRTGGAVFTGTRPKARAISSDNSVIQCPASSNSPLTCRVLKQGSATISFETSLVPLKFWVWQYDLFGNLLVDQVFSPSRSLNDFFAAAPGASMFNALPWLSASVSLESFLYDDFLFPDFNVNERGYISSDIPTSEYLTTHGDVIDRMPWPLTWGLVYNGSQLAGWNVAMNLNLPFGGLPGVSTYYPGVSWLGPQLPFHELKNMDLAASSGETFRQAVVKRFPVSVPVVSEFTPGSRSDTIFIPGYSDIPTIPIVISEPENNNRPPNPPTVVPESPVEVGEYSTVTMTATDPDSDDIRYCIDWNMNGTIDTGTPSGMTDDERCTAYVPSGTSRNTWQSWNTPGTKTFQVRTEDRGGLFSAWTTATVIVTTGGGSSGNNPTGSLTVNGTTDSTNNNNDESTTVPTTQSVLPVSWNCLNADSGRVLRNGTLWRSGLSGSLSDTVPSSTSNRVYRLECSRGNVTATYGVLVDFIGGSSCIPTTEMCGDGIDQDCNGSDLTCPTSGPICNNNTICERSRGENFFNCRDCRGILKEF